jgi:hypothetical protein
LTLFHTPGNTQAAAIYDYAEALCRIAGKSIGNLLRAQHFVASTHAPADRE